MIINMYLILFILDLIMPYYFVIGLVLEVVFTIRFFYILVE